jgi:hypothetical protein
LVVWLAHGFNTDNTIGVANVDVQFHIAFPLNEAFAVLNGRSPLVDFTTQYGALWAYVEGGAMSVFGDSLTVYVVVALAATALCMLAMFNVLARVARSWLAGLMLFLPFLATSFFMMKGPPDDRYTFGNYFGAFPIRYAAPFVAAWLLARYLDTPRQRRLGWIFFWCGLALLNTVDTGIPALGATIAGVLWGTAGKLKPVRLILPVVVGLGSALAAVVVLVFWRTGALPELGRLVFFARIFGNAGFGSMPMPTLGLHLVVYLTFVAAIGVATARALAGERDRLLTGMLAWSGVFGLGAGAYYVGRSHPESLIASFSTWSFTLALLLVVVIRAVAGRLDRVPNPAQLACIFGFAVAVCSLAQTPEPWRQVRRLGQRTQPVLARPEGQSIVAALTRPGERVLIMLIAGHRIAENTGVMNVSPYGPGYSIPTRQQLYDSIQALRESGGSKVFFSPKDFYEDEWEALEAAGYRSVAVDEASGVRMYADRSAR